MLPPSGEVRAHHPEKNQRGPINLNILFRQYSKLTEIMAFFFDKHPFFLNKINVLYCIIFAVRVDT